LVTQLTIKIPYYTSNSNTNKHECW